MPSTPSLAAGAATTDAPHRRVEVRRSRRRTRTVQAYVQGDAVIVMIPARMTAAEERFWVAEMVGRLDRQEERSARRRQRSDSDLLGRARTLSHRYLDGRAQPSAVRWVTNQNDRWGSCTPAHGTIRLSVRLRDLPRWVGDYVLVHELVHLLEPGHGSAFWELVGRYPRTERARGYLQGVAAAAGLSLTDGGAEPVDDEEEPGEGTEEEEPDESETLW